MLRESPEALEKLNVNVPTVNYKETEMVKVEKDNQIAELSNKDDN